MLFFVCNHLFCLSLSLFLPALAWLPELCLDAIYCHFALHPLALSIRQLHLSGDRSVPLFPPSTAYDIQLAASRFHCLAPGTSCQAPRTFVHSRLGRHRPSNTPPPPPPRIPVQPSLHNNPIVATPVRLQSKTPLIIPDGLTICIVHRASRMIRSRLVPTTGAFLVHRPHLQAYLTLARESLELVSS